jgi:hypothetical protein
MFQKMLFHAMSKSGKSKLTNICDVMEVAIITHKKI